MRAQRMLVASLPAWCSMPAARGEKIVRSMPRSRARFNCDRSIVSRISSSPKTGSASDGARRVSSASASWALRKAASAGGNVV
jgi:hypothetical protein